jgi:hypothetical protein
MELLLRRGQTGRTRHVKFRLWAKTLLDETEQQIMYRYRIDEARIVEPSQPDLLRNAVIIGVVVALVAASIIMNVMRVQWMGVLGAPVGAFAGFLFYDRYREHLLMRDLLHGRYFTCKSIVDLARKEAWVEDAVGILRQVMETAKFWDDVEVVPVEVLSKEAAKFVARRSFFGRNGSLL